MFPNTSAQIGVGNPMPNGYQAYNPLSGGNMNNYQGYPTSGQNYGISKQVPVSKTLCMIVTSFIAFYGQEPKNITTKAL